MGEPTCDGKSARFFVGSFCSLGTGIGKADSMKARGVTIGGSAGEQNVEHNLCNFH